MRTWVFVCLLGFAACQPLYGGAADGLHTPAVKPRPVEKGQPIVYIESCSASFQEDPRTWHAQPKLAPPLIQTGDTDLVGANKAPDEPARVGLVRDAIEKYRLALQKDPYNADATVKLAVAYDKVLRKGCALAMLRRLSSLSGNPKFANATTAAKEAVTNNPGWFKGYRVDALTAAGL